MKTGMVSVTFRDLPLRQIIDLTRRAGFDGIEWGADVHAVSPQAAAEIRAAMEDLTVFSLGSYYRLCKGHNFNREVAIAKALGAPNIRIWASPWEPAQVTREQRAAAVREAQQVCDLAAEEGMTVSFEYHGGTLTCTQESAVLLYQEVNRPNLRLYWQPLNENPVDERVGHIRQLGEMGALLNLHVYHWISFDGERFPLAAGEDLWQKWIDAAQGYAQAAFLEFVKNDSQEQFLEDAAVLRRMVKGE